MSSANASIAQKLSPQSLLSRWFGLKSLHPAHRTTQQWLDELEQWAAREDIVFITGVPRTGTTRFYDVMSRVPAFERQRGKYCETHLMKHLPRFRNYRKVNVLYNYLGRPHEHERDLKHIVDAMQQLPQPERRVPFIRGFFYCAKKHSGMKRLVEKTPSHCRHIKELRAALPKSKYFFLIRQPIEIYASMRRRMKKEIAHGMPEKEWRWMDKSPEQFAQFFRKFCEAYLVAEQELGGDLYLLRYEDLCSRPHEVVADALAWLGLEFSEEYLEPRGRTKNPVADLIYQPIKRYDRPWQEHVERGEADVIQNSLADMLERFDMKPV